MPVLAQRASELCGTVISQGQPLRVLKSWTTWPFVKGPNPLASKTPNSKNVHLQPMKEPISSRFAIHMY